VRLLGAAHVRNEADIVEAFVRHNLGLLDGIAIVDHGSVDATPDILRALTAEGLPIFVAQEPRPVFDQQALQNRLVRHVFATSDAAWVFPLDADEFLRAPSPQSLRATLGAHPAATDVALEWQTYLPSFESGGESLARLRGARRVQDDRHDFRKVAVSRRFAADPDLYLIRGQHGVMSRRANAPRRMQTVLPPGEVALAHVPVRSAAQFTVKIAIGWLSSLRAPKRQPNESYHWKQAFDYLQSGRPLTAGQLAAFACNYGVPMERWLPTDAQALVDDPFLRDFELRYPKGAEPSPLPYVLREVARLLAADAITK
jgi:hypothetical protein